MKLFPSSVVVLTQDTAAVTGGAFHNSFAATWIVSLILLVPLEYLTRTYWVKRWRERGLDFSAFTLMNFGSRALGVGAITGVWILLGVPLGGTIAVGAVSWLAILAAQTDIAARKIPREPSWVVTAITVACAFTAGMTGFVDAAIAIVLVAVIAFTVGGTSRFGFGDVRLLAAFAPLSAFTSVYAFPLGFVVAVLLQFAYRAVRRIPWGRTAPFAPAISAGFLIANTAVLMFAPSW